MKIGPARSEKTASTTGQCRRNFGHNRQRDFLRRFTASVESGGREQIVERAMGIEDSIFAQLRQNL
jgi:hypothetical protein